MIGSSLAHYRIVAKLGEGGMGEVYRATDTKLKRDVAIKVLPPAFTEDEERLARFEREAQMLAQLHHPNIASIFGLEESNGIRALVMELVEGPTLAERLESGSLPFNESLSFALQIAQALEEAHEKGIIHRDLKPQNVKAPIEGKVKVLDFGLAKAMDLSSGASSAADLARSPTLLNSPTLTAMQGTQLGVILGTAAYMAPEQAKGLPVDKRADIWAFGVVLYEMLVGRSLFAGDTVTDTLAGVLKTEIDFSKLPAETPAALRRLLRRCLERNPKNRLHDIGDARLEIDAALGGAEVEISGESAAPDGRSRRGLMLAGVLIGVAAGVLIGVLAARREDPAPSQPPLRLALAPPAEITGFRSSPRISPDGRSIAYFADGRLWIQELDGLTPRQVPKSEGAGVLTWSPDGSSLAFTVHSQLLRMLPNGDVAQIATLKDSISSNSGGIAWTDDDAIVFTTGSSELFTVPAAGGSPRVLLEPDKAHESDFHQPIALPGGRGVAFIVHRTPEGVRAIDLLVQGQRRRLYQDDERGSFDALAWSESGHLLIADGGSNNGVWAVPLDPRDLRPTGQAFLVAANASSPSVSRDGTLLLSNFANTGSHQLVVVDRNGERLAAIGEPMRHADQAAFSPDGKRIAYCEFESEAASVRVYDLERDSRNRLWSGVDCGGVARGFAWSGDGERLAISDGKTGAIRIRRTDGSDQESKLTDGAQPDLSRDGKLLLFTRTAEKTTQDIWYLPLGGGDPVPFLATEASEQQPHLSPDRRFLAYVSDETGHREVLLRPFPSGAGRWQVSTSGGDMPRWSADGRRLFFVQGDGQVMEVEIDLRGTPVLSDPRPLFSSVALRLGPAHGYDPAPDGNGFVTVELGSASGSGGDLTLIRPWPGQETAK
ncbi:MAG TPA: protein kinase [Thermoanaerobaculia bacterium]|nr:protein kinase [Thermoanaerobaculia bacterium]